MSDRQQQRAIGVFSDAQTTQEALQELQSAGFPMENVSVIGKDADPDKQVGGAEVSDRIGETKVESATSAVANAASAGAFGTVMLGLTSLVHSWGGVLW
uniref:General stress protein n=1 Tax=Desertifilum tharense IPPAS B-1220 TaxID=1781255 RepID=A0ACD5GSE4_9CYAN